MRSKAQFFIHFKMTFSPQAQGTEKQQNGMKLFLSDVLKHIYCSNCEKKRL